MKIRVLLASFMVLLANGIASAQKPAEVRTPPMPANTPSSSADVSLSELKPTPEMWFYLQERQRYDNPKYAVHRNAELDAARRSDRIAALQWFGVSPERPNVTNTVFGSLFASPNPYGGYNPTGYYYSGRTTHSQPPEH